MKELRHPLRNDRDIFNALEVMIAVPHVVRAIKAGAQIQKRRNSLMRSHILISRHGRRRMVDSRANLAGRFLLGRLNRRQRCRLRLRHSPSLHSSNLLSQLDDLAFHLGVATAFPNPFEVGFDFTIQLQTTTSGAIRPRVLNNITSELLRKRRLITIQVSHMSRMNRNPKCGVSLPFVDDIHYKPVSRAVSSSPPDCPAHRHHRYCPESCPTPPWSWCASWLDPQHQTQQQGRQTDG